MIIIFQFKRLVSKKRILKNERVPRLTDVHVSETGSLHLKKIHSLTGSPSILSVKLNLNDCCELSQGLNKNSIFFYILFSQRNEIEQLETDLDCKETLHTTSNETILRIDKKLAELEDEIRKLTLKRTQQEIEEIQIKKQS